MVNLCFSLCAIYISFPSAIWRWVRVFLQNLLQISVVVSPWVGSTGNEAFDPLRQRKNWKAASYILDEWSCILNEWNAGLKKSERTTSTLFFYIDFLKRTWPLAEFLQKISTAIAHHQRGLSAESRTCLPATQTMAPKSWRGSRFMQNSAFTLPKRTAKGY